MILEKSKPGFRPSSGLSFQKTMTSVLDPFPAKEPEDLFSIEMQETDRNPHGTTYVEWIIAIVDREIPERPGCKRKKITRKVIINKAPFG